MSVIEMHPEELFDKLVDGSLSGDERERLQAHLAACETCRFELSVRGDFHAELSALDASAPAPELSLPVPAKLERRSKTRRRAVVWALAAAALFIASGALASVVTGESPWKLLASLASDGAPDPDASVARAKARAPRSAPVAAAPAPSSTAPPATVSAAPPATDPIPLAPEPAAAGSIAAPTLARANLPAPSAAELFASANQARGARETRRAVELYRSLQQRYPRSPEAELSRLTLATLLLHVGEARAALAAFDAYLSSGARPLEAEAQVGRALALRALGLREQELSAWRLVAQRNPGTPYERRARERLSVLGQP